MPSKTPRPEGKKRLKFIDTFIDDSIGARSEEVNNEPSFESLPEDEQADLMYNLQSLLAERRDLVRSLQEARSESTAEQPAQAFVMKKIGKHFVKKPVNAPAPFSQEKAKSIDDAEHSFCMVSPPAPREWRGIPHCGLAVNGYRFWKDPLWWCACLAYPANRWIMSPASVDIFCEGSSMISG